MGDVEEWRGVGEAYERRGEVRRRGEGWVWKVKWSKAGRNGGVAGE